MDKDYNEVVYPIDFFQQMSGLFRPDEKLKLKVKLLHDDAKEPIKSTEEAAGFDFFAIEDCVIQPNEVTFVNTGVAVEIPNGWWGFTRPRSGLATKYGLAISSSSTIDSDYRGELRFPLTTHKTEPYHVTKGDKIGQMMLLPNPPFYVEVVQELSETKRGSGGFGSTGMR